MTIEEIQAAYYVVAATGVLVAAAFYILNLRISMKNQELGLKAQQQSADARQAQLLMSLHQKTSDPDFEEAFGEIMFKWEWSSIEDFEAKYGLISNPKKWRRLTYIGNYFEGVGILVKNGFIDAKLVDDLMSVYVVRFWQKFGPYFKEVRVRYATPTTAEFMEYLYNAVYKIWLEQHPENPRPLNLRSVKHP